MGPAAEHLSLRRYGASHGSHSHAHFQILLGLAGTLDLEVGGRGLRLGSGQGCVIVPGERHDFESVRGSLCLVLDSDHAGWEPCARQPLPPAHALPLAQYLAAALCQGLPLAQQHGPALLRETWGAAMPLAASASVPVAHLQPAGRPIDWAALQRWAAQRWHTPLQVADLAARVHLSPGQFAARCRAEWGMGAMAWLRGLRLAQARALRASGLGVAEVARRCGYRSPSALTAALRREGI